MNFRLPLMIAIIALCSASVQAQQQVQTLSQSRANLLSASNDYRGSLEKLLELQRQDELRVVELVKARKELLALGAIDKRDLEDGERALAEVQGKIAETMKRIAEIDQTVAEANASDSIYAQTTKRLKVYIKIESKSNAYKIESSLRRQLNSYPKYKSFALFVFPSAQVENGPDLTLIVKERTDGTLAGWLNLSINGQDPGAMTYYSDCRSLAKDILMFTAVNVRILAVGRDQALEEWATAFQEASEKAEKADGARKQKSSVNATRTKTVKKP